MPEMLSQEEIDALLNGGDEEFNQLSDHDKDVLGEIGNISMGTAATTLFTLLNQKVTITTPRVFETNIAQLATEIKDPCVLINIRYIEGIKGLNLLVLHEQDVKVITDLMMGGDGTNTDGELSELHLSAIGEAMNQMVGSSSTSMSEMLGKKIDISPPNAMFESIANIDVTSLGIGENEELVKIAFDLEVGDLIDSEIMQVLPLEVAQQLVISMTEMTSLQTTGLVESVELNENEVKVEEVNVAPAEPVVQEQEPVNNIPQQPAPQPMMQHQNPVNVQAFQYENFGAAPQMNFGADIELIKDVPLEITVELGHTVKQISDILDFGVGTVVELDRLVGETLDILANGKKIAKGEVVVVDENYGIRITDIIIPEKRIHSV